MVRRGRPPMGGRRSISRGKNLQTEDDGDMATNAKGMMGCRIRGGADHVRAGATEPASRVRRARFINAHP